jgi:hypothetical protein
MKIIKIETCRFENSLLNDASIIVDCILDLEDEYKIKAMFDNDCFNYFFIDIVIAQKVCDSLRITLLKLNKSREVKSYDERRDKDIIHVIYSFIIIKNHTESFNFMMITKLDQHLIILKNTWMKKHEVNYHEHDDSILFHFNHCNYLEASEHFYSNQIKKKDSFSKRIFFDQSKIIKNKERKIFLEKINHSSKTILKRSTSAEFNERLNERSKRLTERRRIDESWRKKLKKIEISLSRILLKGSRKNSFFDEISSRIEKIFY